jgi:ribose transport system permease protein
MVGDSFDCQARRVITRADEKDRATIQEPKTDDDAGKLRRAVTSSGPVKLEPPAAKSVVGAARSAPSGSGSRAGNLRLLSLKYGMVWALVVLVIVAEFVSPTFLTLTNIRNMMSQNAALAIISVGMTCVIICGGFDLSVGSIWGLSAVAFAVASPHASELVSALAAVLVGTLAGSVNALIVTRLKVNPFVATLATSSAFLGIGYVWSNNNPVHVAATDHEGLGLGQLAGFPISGWIIVVTFLAGGMLLSRTILGQGIYAVGGSSEAARLAGLRINLIRASTYLIVGALTGLAGAIDTSKLGVAQTDQGQNLTLLSITCVILGGNALLGGEGSMWRTVVGLAIVATLANVLDTLAVNTQVQLIIQGVVLVAAVSFDHFARSVSVGGRNA